VSHPKNGLEGCAFGVGSRINQTAPLGCGKSMASNISAGLFPTTGAGIWSAASNLRPEQLPAMNAQEHRFEQCQHAARWRGKLPNFVRTLSLGQR